MPMNDVIGFFFVECLNVTLCEDSGQENANISCPENKIISLKSILYGEFPCQNATNRKICYSNINAFFNKHCLGQNNCTLPVNILFHNNCQRASRRLKVQYKCDGEDNYTTCLFRVYRYCFSQLSNETCGTHK